MVSLSFPANQQHSSTTNTLLGRGAPQGSPDMVIDIVFEIPFMQVVRLRLRQSTPKTWGGGLRKTPWKERNLVDAWPLAFFQGHFRWILRRLFWRLDFAGTNKKRPKCWGQVMMNAMAEKDQKVALRKNKNKSKHVRPASNHWKGEHWRKWRLLHCC